MNRYIYILFFILLTLTPARSGAGELVVLTENNPPFNFPEHGELKGLSTDILLEMAKTSGIKIERKDIQIWPWARSYAELETKDNVILYSMARLKNREKHFQWIGPIMEFRSVLIALKTRGIRIHNLVQDSYRYTIGTTRKSGSEQYLLRKGVPPGRLQAIHNLELNVQKLHEGRVDLLAITEPAFWHFVKTSRLDPKSFEIVHVLLENDLYFAASKDMNPTVVRKLQKALDRIKTSGKFKSITDKYL